MAMAKTQRFEIMTIHRSEIKNAPYNPRRISKEAAERLKKGLKKFGLASTLTWNQRTGNLVSGHQRLAQMDILEGTQDYEITVSAIDVSLKDEMALNVQMNNQSMMGEFDIDSLVDMVDMGADLDDFGFSDSDIDVLFGDSELAQKFTDNSEVEESKEKLRDIKQDRSEWTENLKKDNSAAYYFTVICSSADEREELFRQMGVPFSEEFVNSKMLYRIRTSE